MSALFAPSAEYPYRYAWKNNPKRAQMYGRACRILARGALGSVLVEFEGGQREIVSRRALRRRENLSRSG